MTTQTLTTFYCQFCDAVAEFFSTRLENHRHRRKVNDGIRQLRRMTDKELQDIGISRGDINRVANGEWSRLEKF